MSRVLAMNTLRIQKRIFWVLLLFVLITFSLYGYFVSKSITNVLLREEVEQELAEVNSKISVLEFTYLEQKDSISLELALERGFHTITDKTFVTRKTFLGTRLTGINEI